MDISIKENLIASYQVDGAFVVHDRTMLEKIYGYLGIDPKHSLDWRIYDLEGITHFFQHGVAALAKKLKIKETDQVLSLGEGSGAPSRLIVKLTGCAITGIDINPHQIKKARDLAALHGVEGKVTYVEQNVEDFSLEKKDFSKAYINETCGHWQHKASAFARLFLHLRSGAHLGFNVWLKGDKGSLNDAYDRIEEFRPLYKQGIWFQDDLATYERLLKQAGFRIDEMYDCTDRVDVRMRARVNAITQWERYESVMGKSARESALRYYEGMIKTHYDYLKYGVIIAEKQ